MLIEETEEYKKGWKDLEQQIKDAIETYDAAIFICIDCGKLAYMIDPGDGLITHIS